MWDYLEKIEKYGTSWVVYIDKKKSDASKTLLTPFSTVTDLISDVREQEALLTHLSCSEAVAKLGPMLKGMLKGDFRHQVLPRSLSMRTS